MFYLIQVPELGIRGTEGPEDCKFFSAEDRFTVGQVPFNIGFVVYYMYLRTEI
jgi:hypothetical protein